MPGACTAAGSPDRRRLSSALRAIAFAGGLALAQAALGQGTGRLEVQKIEGHLAEPARQPFSDERLRQLLVPPGFTIEAFALDLREPRMLAVSADGTVYVTERQAGQVTALADTDGDGIADRREAAVTGLAGVHGVAIRNDMIYMATVRQVLAGRIAEDGGIGDVQRLIGDLPEGGQHPNRTLGIGPDGDLYISVGSPCNACAPDSGEQATILHAEPNGRSREVFAKGLRNTIGFDWHPRTRELWGMDHGSDWRGDDLPPEELNHIRQGDDYGWPWCYGEAEVDPYIPGKPGDAASHQAYCDATEPAELGYQAHSAPMGMAFYDGESFPEDYRGDAFVALHGSWNRNPPTGYKIIRIRFENGRPTEAVDFVTGFLSKDGATQFGRPAGVAVAADGALLFTDDANGVIYRVSYTGE
ncbi:MAG TPA: PQQ-dependent sugar dehydrogenase [Alphaproteobacteria bacterium]|nr:PQQ-dependent sugar dehydrogenase [Alphaproteobacteria bacterium]